MASQADTKADAAAAQAYADASGQVTAKVADAVKADASKPEPETGKTAKAAEPKAKAQPAVKKKSVSKKPASRKPAAKKKVAAPKAKAKTARKAPAKSKPAGKPVSKPVSNTKPRISELKDTIMATAQKTEKTAADFTKTAQNAASELQSRAKTAYDKTQAYAGEMTEFSKGNFEAFVESGKILGKGVRSMARSEADAARGAFETVTADLKAFAAVKSPTELFKLQGEIARRNFDAAVAHYSKNAEVSMKLANEAFAPLSSRMSLAAEKLSKAA